MTRVICEWLAAASLLLTLLQSSNAGSGKSPIHCPCEVPVPIPESMVKMLCPCLPPTLSAQRYRAPRTLRNVRCIQHTTCNTGFGDRLLECLSFSALANLTGLSLHVHWQRTKDTLRHFGLFHDSLETLQSLMQWVDFRSIGITLSFTPVCRSIPVPIRNTGMFLSAQAYSSFRNYLDPGVTMDEYHRKYRQAALQLQPGPRGREFLAKFLRDDVLPYASIHIRRTDKVWPIEGKFRNTQIQLQNITEATLKSAQQLEAAGIRSFYVASDSPGDWQTMVSSLEALGMDVVAKDARELQGADLDMLEFWMMAKSIAILQAVRFSTFSTAASLVGDVPLLNTDRTSNAVIQNFVAQSLPFAKLHSLSRDHERFWISVSVRLEQQSSLLEIRNTIARKEVEWAL